MRGRHATRLLLSAQRVIVDRRNVRPTAGLARTRRRLFGRLRHALAVGQRISGAILGGSTFGCRCAHLAPAFFCFRQQMSVKKEDSPLKATIKKTISGGVGGMSLVLAGSRFSVRGWRSRLTALQATRWTRSSAQACACV